MEKEFTEKAKVLIEALPFIREHYGKTMVVKLGGSAMVEKKEKENVVTDLTLMKYVGINPIVVHGGGPQITDFLRRLSIPTEFKEGMRITDEETMKVVKMVLLGVINKELVSNLNQHGCLSIGISGEDGNFIRVKPIRGMGLVGEPQEINGEFIENLIEDGYLPVIASIGVNQEGVAYNINADLVASRIAISLKADKLIFLTDVDGIYEDASKKEEIISEMSLKEAEALLKKGKVSEGMIPKLKSSIEALKGGVKRVHFLNGKKDHSLLLELFTERGIGTMIKGES
jgi:acetylglutamate kinase